MPMPPAQAAPLAAFEPMLLCDRKTLPRTGQWHYELKYDGYRALAGTSPAALRTRNGADASRWFAEVVQSLKALPRGAHVLDGEVVVLDEYGRPDFDRLHRRARRRGYQPGDDLVVYCVFDLLVYRGRDLRAEPIEVRREKLQQLLAEPPRGMLCVGTVDDGHWLYQQAVALQLEGIVAKRAHSPYVGGRSSDWLKIKRPGAIPPGRFHRAI